MDSKQEKKRKYEKKRRNPARTENIKRDFGRLTAADSSERSGYQQRAKSIQMPPRECPYCHKPITDFGSAIADKESGEPVHFDCVLNYLCEHESLSAEQSIAYIGQGRFAVVVKKSVHPPTFSIERIIEWESRDKTYEWRSMIADVYSSIK